MGLRIKISRLYINRERRLNGKDEYMSCLKTLGGCFRFYPTCMYVVCIRACVFIKLLITAQSGPAILVWILVIGGINACCPRENI